MNVGRLAPVGPDLGLDLLALVVPDVAEHHGGAFPDEHPPPGRALSARAAADQRYLAVESSHRRLLVRIGSQPIDVRRDAALQRLLRPIPDLRRATQNG